MARHAASEDTRPVTFFCAFALEQAVQNVILPAFSRAGGTPVEAVFEPTFACSGPSGIYFASLLERLGIAEQVKARATVIDAGPTAVALLDGRPTSRSTS
ncbi:UNVERIFIED_ORG: hypothetical protein ABIB52_002183 [Arthrobacter sp. UYCu721]